jgi:hypothetical protein
VQPIFEGNLPAEWNRFREHYTLFFENGNRAYRGLLRLLNGIKIQVPEDNVVHLMAVASLRDFNEVVLLCGHGFGIGSAKIVRGFYERVVTVSYLSEHTNEIQAWIDYSAVNWNKLVKEGAVAAGIEDWIGAAQTEKIRKMFVQTRPKFSSTERRGVQPNWTKHSVPDLAKNVSAEMRSLYFNGFLSPTMYIHPTFIGLTQQIEFLEQGRVTVNMKIEDEEVRVSLGVAHGLLLQLYSVINRYFSLGQDSELKIFCDAFAACWPDAQREVVVADATPK